MPLERRLGGRVTFLSDESGEVLDALGLRDVRGAAWYDKWLLDARDGDIPMPATVVVRGDGAVGLLHRSATVDDRPSVRAVLDNIVKP